MAALSSVHAAATIKRYLRTETQAWMRKRVFLAALEKWNRIKYDVSGEGIQWPVRIKRTPIVGFGSGDQLTMQQINKRKPAFLDMRALIMSESMNQYDKWINKGPEAIVKLWSNKIKELTADFRDQLPYVLINNDGYSTTGDARKKHHGLESMFGATVNAGKYAGTNNDNYANISTVRGELGGSSTDAANWPDGTVDPQYDAWSPLVLDTTSTIWGANASFSLYSIEQLRYMRYNCERNGDAIDFFLLAKQMHMDHVNNLDEKERLVAKSNDSKLRAAGFGDAINQDGIDLMWDTDVQSNVGYALCMDQLTLHVWEDQLLTALTDFNLESMADQIVLTSPGTLQAENPRVFGKFAVLTV